MSAWRGCSSARHRSPATWTTRSPGQWQPELPASFDDLHDLLEGQSYRLAYWRAASHEINYRRFFDVNDLAALRIEDPAVFEATHARMVRLVREEKITGLRIDHIDGLFDPSGYLSRLHEATGPCYVVVEKILTGNETLREGWLTHGTTGYEFLNDLNGIFVDSRGERPLRRFYERFTDARRRSPSSPTSARSSSSRPRSRASSRCSRMR